MSCNGVVSKIYFCNLLIFVSYSFPNVCQDAGLIQKSLQQNVKLLLKQLIRVVTLRNSQLPVLLQNKKLRVLLLSHNLRRWYSQLLFQLLLLLLQLKLRQLQLLNLSLNQSKKRLKLLELQQSQKFKKHQNQHQLLIISRNTTPLKVLTTLKLSLNQTPALLFQET